MKEVKFRLPNYTIIRNDVGLELLSVLSDHIEGRQSCAEITNDLRAIAQSHQVLPILFYQTKSEELKKIYLQTINVFTQRKVLLEQITKAFTEIPFYTVKGISVSKYYPIPQLRTMGDCDIIVHERDKEKAKQLLLSLGFNYVESDQDCTELHFEKYGLDFELHYSLVYDNLTTTTQEKEFSDTAWEYVKEHEIDPNFHFVFVLIHLKKHLLHHGVGLRQFMDLAMLSKNADLNPNTIDAFLKQTGLERFASVCSSLCLRWFDTPLPVKPSEISDEFYSYATDMILANGVFGMENSKNEGKDVLNSISRYGKVKAVLYKFFPSYRGCAGTLKYKWIKGKPYLMPILWMYRPFEFLLSGRFKEGFEHISAVVGSNKAMAERSQELSAWGL